jgi:hypothetical protein
MGWAVELVAMMPKILDGQNGQKYEDKTKVERNFIASR